MKNKIKIGGKFRILLLCPLLLSILPILLTLTISFISIRACIVSAVFTVAYIGAALWAYFMAQRMIQSGVVEFSAAYNHMQSRMTDELRVPYAVADEKGRFLWMNREFARLQEEEKSKGIKGGQKSILTMFPDIKKEQLETIEKTLSVHTSYGDKMYQVDLCRVQIGGEQLAEPFPIELTAVYLFDETRMLTYMKQINDQKLVAGLVYLDNYDEALESVEEVRRSLLTALIDRKINKYISSMSGIVKKMEKDKYFFVVEQRYIHKIQEDRFSILEEVKNVNIGNEMAVTLSIGIGINGDSYSQNYEYARASIDMALGRGGDQAVVKDGTKILYYGGKAQQVEKTTRVKARVKAHALRELMENKDRLLIMGHRLADVDSFGAAVGIYRIATALNKKAHIVVNEVTASVRPMMERFTSSGEYPEDMFLKGHEAAELADAGTILVVVDINRPSITDEPALLKLIKTVVVLDHHRTSSEIIDGAVLSYVEPYASSACEMVAEILQYIADGIRIKPAEADAMYAGIVIDTQNFTNQTGVRTFEAAAFLRRNGADITRVRKMFREDMASYQAKAEAVHAAEVFEKNFAISVCPSQGLESPTIVGAQAANELLAIRGIKASVVLTPYNGTIFYSARSMDEVNVQVMMEKLGGGGHRTIAGAQIEGISVEEGKERIKAVIRQMLENGEIS